MNQRGGSVVQVATMRTFLAVAVLVAATDSAAFADENVAGVYDIKIEEMASNCSPVPITLVNKTLKIDISGPSLTVNLDTVPLLKGSPAKSGRIAAKMPKPLPTTFGGLDGNYSIAGHVTNGALELVMIAEYTRSDTKKPYCTQSWTITGKHSAAK